MDSNLQPESGLKASLSGNKNIASKGMIMATSPDAGEAVWAALKPPVAFV
ncbi:MAG: hypothetical protein JWR19_949 [Pedosphaera sp.]|nr:hypothetical protein [Pedosphaera sp.]